MRFHVEALVKIGRGRRQPIPAAVSPISLVPEHSRYVSTSPENSGKFFLSTRPELLAVAGVELDLLLLGDPDHADGRDASAGFLLVHSCTFVSLACRRCKALEFELHLVQSGCLSREVSSHPHEPFDHSLQISRGLFSRLRYRDKMTTR